MNAPLNISFCTHRNTDLRAFTCINGSLQYVMQCLSCGERIGSPIKKSDAIKSRGNLEFLLPFDESLRASGREAYQAQCRIERETKRAESKANFDEWYAEYLNSDEWMVRRQKVIQRAKGVCEGCLSARAVLVHHLTYDHRGDELMFELVALCHPCHERAHRVRGTEQG